MEFWCWSLWFLPIYLILHHHHRKQSAVRSSCCTWPRGCHHPKLFILIGNIMGLADSHMCSVVQWEQTSVKASIEGYPASIIQLRTNHHIHLFSWLLEYCSLLPSLTCKTRGRSFFCSTTWHWVLNFLGRKLSLTNLTSQIHGSALYGKLYFTRVKWKWI